MMAGYLAGQDAIAWDVISAEAWTAPSPPHGHSHFPQASSMRTPNRRLRCLADTVECTWPGPVAGAVAA
jgi:hypothetical protein